jgi:DNA-binding GntR family transcriptional regulator
MQNERPLDIPDVRPVDDMTVAKIFESVRTSIISGAIPPGSLINSVEIAHQFGTSRTPVREALLLLSQYGLITLEARRRPRVADVSVKAIQDLYAVRTAMHAYISEAIVLGASTDALLALKAHAVKLIEDFELHTSEEHLLNVESYLSSEAQLCGNGIVIGVLDSLKWKISWFRRLGLMSREQLKVLAVDRLRVVEAYLDRDARLAEALNRSMLKKAGQYCEQNFIGAQHQT